MTRTSAALFGALLALTVGLAGAAPEARAFEVRSYAFVEDDATLRIKGRRIRLHGVYLPATGRTCRTTIRPVRCASYAALALDFRIHSHFVGCRLGARRRDGTYLGRCKADGEDLGIYLIRRGWALAAPGASFPYRAAERIAERNRRGVWGMGGGVVTRIR